LPSTTEKLVSLVQINSINQTEMYYSFM
jgi:hypothetical protein